LIVTLCIILTVIVLRPAIATQEISICEIRIRPGESLQEAITQAPEGAVICLAPGLYRENLTINKSITLRGEGANPKETLIIKAEEGDVIAISGPPKVVILENLAVAGSWPEYTAGIHITGSVRVELSDCFLTGNDRGLWAGGSALVTLQRCTISGNGYGLLLEEAAKVSLQNSPISDNGLGVWVVGSAEAILIDCAISDNYWGVIAAGSARLELNTCTITGSLGDGIRLTQKVSATVNTSRILNNSGYGVLLYTRDCLIPISARYNSGDEFTGLIMGGGNIIPERNEPDGNRRGSVCPPYPGDPWPEGFKG
jgi:parallel beta-helix repeat protein